MSFIPVFEDIEAAIQLIAPHVHRTPLLTSGQLDALSGAHLFFKCENFQKVGAFKYRGATNAVLNLTDAQRAAGVVTHSSGNHAAALAHA
ncbi:MAG: pyridoxal-phosphate dependent enzyme, partial [Bacteroidales bacterium]